jgi:hypothetical protein
MAWKYVARIKSGVKDADQEEKDMADLGEY